MPFACALRCFYPIQSRVHICVTLFVRCSVVSACDLESYLLLVADWIFSGWEHMLPREQHQLTRLLDEVSTGLEVHLVANREAAHGATFVEFTPGPVRDAPGPQFFPDYAAAPKKPRGRAAGPSRWLPPPVLGQRSSARVNRGLAQSWQPVTPRAREASPDAGIVVSSSPTAAGIALTKHRPQSCPECGRVWHVLMCGSFLNRLRIAL
jgi:hypothetical protein